MYHFCFCPDCGHPLAASPGDPWRLVSQLCAGCGAVHYRNAKPSAGALVVRQGAVLLGRRAVEPARGCWDIPGGFLNPWEHPADGAIREVAEETGLTVQALELFAVAVDTYLERHYVLNIYYLAEPLGGEERAGDDIDELRWFAPDELPENLAFATAANPRRLEAPRARLALSLG